MAAFLSSNLDIKDKRKHKEVAIHAFVSIIADSITLQLNCLEGFEEGDVIFVQGIDEYLRISDVDVDRINGYTVIIANTLDNQQIGEDGELNVVEDDIGSVVRIIDFEDEINVIRIKQFADYKVDEIGIEYTMKIGENLKLISKRFYGTVNLWWVIAEASGIEFPWGIEAGTILRIPSREDLDAALF